MSARNSRRFGPQDPDGQLQADGFSDMVMNLRGASD
jgi:hypothetical protein